MAFAGASQQQTEVQPLAVSERVYVDHSKDPIVDNSLFATSPSKEKAVAATTKRSSMPFPQMLYQMLEQASSDGFDHIVSWAAHGRAFHIHNVEEFEKQVLKKYFQTNRHSSFVRQISIYQFFRTDQGPEKGSWFHEYLLRGRPDLCCFIQREHRLSKPGEKRVRRGRSSSRTWSVNLCAMPTCSPLSDGDRTRLSSASSFQQRQAKSQAITGVAFPLPVTLKDIFLESDRNSDPGLCFPFVPKEFGGILPPRVSNNDRIILPPAHEITSCQAYDMHHMDSDSGKPEGSMTAFSEVARRAAPEGRTHPPQEADRTQDYTATGSFYGSGCPLGLLNNSTDGVCFGASQAAIMPTGGEGTFLTMTGEPDDVLNNPTCFHGGSDFGSHQHLAQLLPCNFENVAVSQNGMKSDTARYQTCNYGSTSDYDEDQSTVDGDDLNLLKVFDFQCTVDTVGQLDSATGRYHLDGNKRDRWRYHKE